MASLDLSDNEKASAAESELYTGCGMPLSVNTNTPPHPVIENGHNMAQLSVAMALDYLVIGLAWIVQTLLDIHKEVVNGLRRWGCTCAYSTAIADTLIYVHLVICCARRYIAYSDICIVYRNAALLTVQLSTPIGRTCRLC